MQMRTPRKITIQTPQGLNNPEYMYAISMPHLLDPDSKSDEQPLLLGDALQALKSTIPDDETLTIFVGGPGHDFFCKTDPTKLDYTKMTNLITKDNAKDVEAIEEIIGAEMNALYEIEVEKKITAFIAHLKTLDSKTIPKLQFTSFNKYIQKLDGKEGRPDFYKDSKEVDYKIYKENVEYKKKIDHHCNSLISKTKDSIPLRFYNKFSKVLQQRNQSKGLDQKTINQALDNLRAKFSIYEHMFYKCLQNHEGVIYYDKGQDSFPESLQDILKSSKTKAGVLHVERLPTSKNRKQLSVSTSSILCSTAKTQRVFIHSSAPTTPASTNQWIQENSTPSSSAASRTSLDTSTPLSDSREPKCMLKSGSSESFNSNPSPHPSSGDTPPSPTYSWIPDTTLSSDSSISFDTSTPPSDSNKSKLLIKSDSSDSFLSAPSTPHSGTGEFISTPPLRPTSAPENSFSPLSLSPQPRITLTTFGKKEGSSNPITIQPKQPKQKSERQILVSRSLPSYLSAPQQPHGKTLREQNEQKEKIKKETLTKEILYMVSEASHHPNATPVLEDIYNRLKAAQLELGQQQPGSEQSLETSEVRRGTGSLFNRSFTSD